MEMEALDMTTEGRDGTEGTSILSYTPGLYVGEKWSPIPAGHEH